MKTFQEFDLWINTEKGKAMLTGVIGGGEEHLNWCKKYFLNMLDNYFVVRKGEKHAVYMTVLNNRERK